ncbi:hypothetical protein BGZ70_002833, partial [Mortierella alpina]
MSDPPFPVRLGIVALKATALWVNTMLTFLQDEYPHSEDIGLDSEHQAQEHEQRQQNLLDNEPQQNQSAAAGASASGAHFTEDNYRRQLLSMLTSQLAVETGAGSSSSLPAAAELLREQLNYTGEDNDNNRHRMNDSVDRALQTDENTVANEVVDVAQHVRTEDPTLAGAIDMLLAMNRPRKPNEQNKKAGNEKYNDQSSRDDQDEQNQQTQQREQSVEHGQDEAQEVSPPPSMITRRVTRGVAAMRNRMELESLQGAMNSAAAAEALEAARTRGQNSDDSDGFLDTEARASPSSAVTPKALTFDHISTPACPNGDVVYRFQDGKSPRQNTWVWSEQSCIKRRGYISSQKLCMGVNQCPECGYAQRPYLSHRKKMPGGVPYAPTPPRIACRYDGTPLVYVGCSARLKVLHANGIAELTHFNTHNHGKPQYTFAAKRTYDEMEGLENQRQSAEEGTAGSAAARKSTQRRRTVGKSSAASKSTQRRRTVGKSSAASKSSQPRRTVDESPAASASTQPQRTVGKSPAPILSTRPQPSVLIDNTARRTVRVGGLPYGLHVDRTKGHGKWTVCSVCEERIDRRTIRVVHKVRDASRKWSYKVMLYHTTCLSHLPKNLYREAQDKLK